MSWRLESDIRAAGLCASGCEYSTSLVRAACERALVNNLFDAFSSFLRSDFVRNEETGAYKFEHVLRGEKEILKIGSVEILIQKSEREQIL
jgi:hypothetical protein